MRYNSGTLNRRDQFPPNQLEGAREQGATREGLFYKLNAEPSCAAASCQPPPFHRDDMTLQHRTPGVSSSDLLCALFFQSLMYLTLCRF